MPVIVWLSMQLLMTGAVWPASASTVANQDSSTLPVTIIICTPSGLKSVVLNNDGSLPEKTPSGEDCPWCLYFSHSAPLTGSLVTLAAPLDTMEESLFVPAPEVRKGQTSLTNFYSRAPPL